MQKIKLFKSPNKSMRLLTVQIEPQLWERLTNKTKELEITKRILINNGIIRILDDIEKYGLDKNI
ncbi:MAG: hypothetical protein ACRC0K_00470 [Fusobacteriaceae bacterium]